MANLDNLTEKIIEEAKIKAEEILKEAEENVKNKKAEIDKQIEEKRKNIMDKAKVEGELIKERVNSTANLGFRDKTLEAKGNVINKVMGLANEKLENLGDEDFLAYLKSKVDVAKLDGNSKLIVGSKYYDVVKNAFSSINVEKDDKVSGFLIDNKGILENYSFSKLLDFNRDDLEEMVAKLLFK